MSLFRQLVDSITAKNLAEIAVRSPDSHDSDNCPRCQQYKKDPLGGKHYNASTNSWHEIPADQKSAIIARQKEKWFLDSAKKRPKESMTRDKLLKRIRTIVYFMASEHGLGSSHYDETVNWYVRAHELVVQWATRFHTSKELVAGVVAALSPQKEWGAHEVDPKDTRSNASAALRVLDVILRQEHNKISLPADPLHDMSAGEYAYRDLSDSAMGFVLAKVIKGIGYTSNREAVLAVRIARGESVPTVLAGKGKVMRFWHNLLDPKKSQHGTVDTWMVRAFLGDPHVGKQGYKLSTGPVLDRPLGGKKDWVKDMGSWPFYESVLQQVGHEFNMQPNSVQALVWDWFKKYGAERFVRDTGNDSDNEMDIEQEEYMSLSKWIEAVQAGHDVKEVARKLVNSVTVAEADRLMGDEGTVKTDGGVGTMKPLTTNPDKPKPKSREGKGVADESKETDEEELDEFIKAGLSKIGGAVASGAKSLGKIAVKHPVATGAVAAGAGALAAKKIVSR